MTFLRRGEATKRILDNTYRPQKIYAREPEQKPQPHPHPAACPKCGKQIGRGRWMHIKHCNG